MSSLLLFVCFVLTCHIATFESAHPRVLAMQELIVRYTGKDAHASMTPWEGVNALDALVIAYTSISALRQQFRQGDQVHGVITSGGTKPNIIPSSTSAYYYLRASRAPDMPLLKEKVLNCFKAAALATGTKLDYEWIDKPYDDIATNHTLAELYTKNLASLGFVLASIEEQRKTPGGSTDMGNVTYTVPGIHPTFNIHATSANHTPAFADAAITDAGHDATWRTAKALAHTAVDVLHDPQILQQVRKEFETTHKRQVGVYVPNFSTFNPTS